jgi:tripartite ATP-independent transporter DctP family solute receptor
LAISGTPVLSAWVPEGQVFDLPYLVQTRDQGLALLTGSIGDWWRETLRQRTGVRSLGFVDYGFRQVYNKTRPIKTPDDLKGLKLRVLENPTYIATYRTLGVKATPMAYGEVYTALQQGVIDGGEANAQGYVHDKFLEVAKFFSYTSATYNPITFLINDNLYNGFPPEIRKAVDEAAKESLAFQKDVARKMEDEAVETMKKAGVTIANPDLAPFVKIVRPAVWNEMMGRIPRGKELVERVAKEADALLPKK